MKRLGGWIFAAGTIVGCIVGFMVATKLAKHDNQPGSSELKLSVHNLKNLDDQDSPQLREYLKGRIYTLVSEGNRSEWVNDKIDYGPIDRKVLRDLVVVKGPDSDEDLYRMAMAAAQGRAQKGVMATNATPR